VKKEKKNGSLQEKIETSPEGSIAGEMIPLPTDSDSGSERMPFPIVGIGASAGGLEALELFVKQLPSNSGIAFVIVQHLDPTHKDIMVELLQRATPIPVIQVQDDLKVEPDGIYVIPPNKDMSILHGVLHLLPPSAPRGLRLPIDFFFRTLAIDLEENSIGVILSGMGTDGTLGLRAIKEKAGATFVQAPSSAKFDGMPRSAIDAGLADVVDGVEELPGRIFDYLHHIPLPGRAEGVLEGKTQSGLDKICVLLRIYTGHDFSLYKKSTIYRRVERRMGLHQIDKIDNYVRLLQETPQETELLFKELLIGVTNFFRDPAAWEKLKNDVIPALLAARPKGGILRAWTPGCSTGEESYSLAIAFKEALAQVRPEGVYTLQIFATDLDRDAVDKARQGIYPANIAADVSPERLRRFFTQENGGFRVNKEIREMIIFAPQNLVMDPPFTKLDILICRNLLIYLAGELQKKLLPLFHYSLNPGGALFLGSSETISGFSSLFGTLDSKMRLYRRLDSTLANEPIHFPSSFFPSQPGTPAGIKPQTGNRPVFPNLQNLVDQVLLQHFSPAAVLTNENGDILYISGRTGKYLEPAAGKVNWNIFAMAREGLRYDLASAFQKALREKNLVILKDLVVGTDGGPQALDLTIQPLVEPDLSGLVLIIFTEITTPAPTKNSSRTRRVSDISIQMTQIEQELQNTRKELQTTRDEMHISQEELKSSNEELQSTNEELQSTNEELTTSKEEMQSLNEELQTVNHELQARLDELSHSNNDMRNLLNSTNIATLFLDDTLKVRRFTNQASQIIKLIPGDVGRPITDISSELIYPELPEDVTEVLSTLVYSEKPVSTRDGRWFTVRIMPYRTMDNRIDGVVITFSDISTAKRLESVLRESESDIQALIKFMPDAFGVFESVFDIKGRFTNCRFVYANDAFETFMDAGEAEMQGKLLQEIYPAADAGWIKSFGQVVASGIPTRFEIVHRLSGKRYLCSVFRPGVSQERLSVVFSEVSRLDEIKMPSN
jgi:two-component system CheB/CheR fusion protein